MKTKLIVVVIVLVALCLLGVVWRAARPRTYRVRYGAMAPTLLGEHYTISCPNCGWTFAVGLHKPGVGGEVECANCRYVWRAGAQGQEDGISPQPTEAAIGPVHGGDLIVVDESAYEEAGPQRWDVVVFASESLLRCRTCGWQGEARNTGDLACPNCGGQDLEAVA
ncbi:MAG: hypothetical protein AMK73_08900, partial [Planctomycetes bacterium SM23_32]